MDKHVNAGFITEPDDTTLPVSPLSLDSRVGWLCYCRRSRVDPPDYAALDHQRFQALLIEISQLPGSFIKATFPLSAFHISHRN